MGSAQAWWGQRLSVENDPARGGLDDPGRVPARSIRWPATRAFIARQKQARKDWRDFGQQPGIHLWLVRAGIWHRELRTAEHQTVARLRDPTPIPGLFSGQALTVSAGGNTFTRKRVAGSSWPGIAKMVYQCHPNHAGYFPAPDAEVRPSRFVRKWFNLAVFVDEADAPILYTSGRNYNRSAGACITFPDRRWLRFPVPDGWQGIAIMTAVDQAGDEVARYRNIGGRTEIIVHPEHPLTDELVLAIAISADWLGSYFVNPRDP